MKRRHRQEWNEKGFRDALVYGRRNPSKREDSAEVAYNEGFADGLRAVDRIRQRPDDKPQPYKTRVIG